MITIKLVVQWNLYTVGPWNIIEVASAEQCYSMARLVALQLSVLHQNKQVINLDAMGVLTRNGRAANYWSKLNKFPLNNMLCVVLELQWTWAPEMQRQSS